MSAVNILTFAVSPFEQNARLLTVEGSTECWVVDPGAEVERLASAAAARSLKVEKILLTHAHIDHGGGVRRLSELLSKEQGMRPLLAACGSEETYMRATLSQQAALFGLSPREYENVPEPDVVLSDGQGIALDGVPVRVLFTPGHAPGHLSFYIAKTRFTSSWVEAGGREVGRIEGEAPLLVAGDAIFAGSIGRTDLPGADYDTLITSIRTKIYALPDDTRILPGHGPDTTVGEEKRSNPFVRG